MHLSNHTVGGRHLVSVWLRGQPSYRTKIATLDRLIFRVDRLPSHALMHSVDRKGHPARSKRERKLISIEKFEPRFLNATLLLCFSRVVINGFVSGTINTSGPQITSQAQLIAESSSCAFSARGGPENCRV